MPINAARLEQTIDRFYEAAAHPELWRSALHEFAAASDALGAQMLYHRPAGAALHTASEGLDEVIEAFFREGWNVNNPRELRARRRRMALEEVITDADLFTKEELDREAWQHDFLDRFGLRWFASFAAFPFDQIAPVILTIERPACHPPFTLEEKRLLGAIVPHVHRAGQLSLAVAAATGSGLLDGLDRVGHGGFLLDDLGRVVRMNASAELMLDETLKVRDGRLFAAAREDNACLDRLISSVTAPKRVLKAPVPAAMAVGRRSRRPLIVQASPLVHSARDFFQQARALIVLTDLDDRVQPDPAILAAAFDLTPGEARVARTIAGGRSPAAVSAELHLSVQTVRVHLKSIFAKTGTRNQSELAVMLHRISRPRAG